MIQRTQIYLDPRQHAALLEEARRLGLSLTGIIRRLIDEHFQRKSKETPGAAARKAAALSIIGLGRSGLSDVSENTDEYVAEAVYADMVKERGTRFRKSARRRK